jgi:SAM-dependent methyltransferase
MNKHHHTTEPEPTVVAWAQQLPESCSILDVAAGGGRHTLWFANKGHRVTAIDQNTEALQSRANEGIRVVTADLENAPWPLPGEQFDAVVVVNYLWRPLLRTILSSVKVGGHLIYETFGVGNERFGRPRNPNFLLRPDELKLAVSPGFRVIEFAYGEIGTPPTAVRQRLFATRLH